MRYVFVVVTAFFFAVGVATADTVNHTIVDRPYDIVPLLTDPWDRQFWLGELEGAPIMYEIEYVATSTLSVQLRQPVRFGDPVAFGLMVVRKDDHGGGVTELARQRSEDALWEKTTDPHWGLRYYEGIAIEKEVGPGTYRIEVSTPINEGTYLLMIDGKDPDPVGYTESLRQARMVQKFFGYTIFSLFVATGLVYPLGILFVLIAIWVTWKYRHKITHYA